MITRKTTLTQNTTTLEASAMQEVVIDELQVLKEPDNLGGIKLLGSRKIAKKEINAAVQLWSLANVGPCALLLLQGARMEQSMLEMWFFILVPADHVRVDKSAARINVALNAKFCWTTLLCWKTMAIWSNLQAGSVAVHLREILTRMPYAICSAYGQSDHCDTMEVEMEIVTRHDSLFETFPCMSDDTQPLQALLFASPFVHVVLFLHCIVSSLGKAFSFFVLF